MTDGLPFDLTGKRVWLAGHRGLVGSAIARRLASEPIGELITATSAESISATRPHRRSCRHPTRRRDHRRRRVGGIHANRSAQGQFLYDNLMISANTLEAARKSRRRRRRDARLVVHLSTGARNRSMKNHLLTGPLEPTNEGYAIAKIAGLEMAKMYRRQYGTQRRVADADEPLRAERQLRPRHLARAAGPDPPFHEAEAADADQVTIWGTGTPRREFLHVDDMADAAIHTLTLYDDDLHLNVGTGEDITISELG